MKAESLNLTTSQGATTAYVARPEKDFTAAVPADSGILGHQ
jgi:hypothetical protein